MSPFSPFPSSPSGTTPAGRLSKGIAATLGALVLTVCHASPAMAQDAPDSGEPAAQDGPARLALVIDASDSMAQTDVDGGSRMDAAKDATVDVLKGLDSGMEVGLIAYGAKESNAPDNKAKGCEDIQVLAGVGTPDVNSLESDVRALQPTGYTPIGKSLEKAAEQLGGEGKRSIVLVSDGEDTCAPPPVCEVAKNLAGAGVDLAIHTVGFRVSGNAQEELECIAKETGGSYSAADNTDTLKQTLSTVVTRAAQAYDAQGTPLELKDNPDEGLYVGEGQYKTMLTGPKDGGKLTDPRWFRVSVPEGTRAIVSSASIMPLKADGDITKLHAHKTLKAENPSCGETSLTGNASSQYPKPPSGAVITIVNKEGCDPNDWRISIQRSGTMAQDLEDEIMVGFEPILTGEEAGTKDPNDDGNPTVDMKPIQPEDQVTPVEGANSYNSATEIQEGTLEDNIVAGETRFYKINVPWGQRPIAQVEFGKARTKDLRQAVLQVATPWRHIIENYGSKGLSDSKPTVIDNQAAYYAYYSNREEGAYKAQGMQDSAYAGLWYIAVNLDGREANGTNIDQNNYTLTVKLDGEEVEGPAWRPSNNPGPEPSAEPMNAAEGGDSGDKNSASQTDGVGEKGSLPLEDNGTNWSTIGLVGLAAVLIMGAIVAMVAKNSRKKKQQGPAQNQHFPQP